jgi:hypothetical protein
MNKHEDVTFVVTCTPCTTIGVVDLTNVDFVINTTVLHQRLCFQSWRHWDSSRRLQQRLTFDDNKPSRTLPDQVKIMVEMHTFAHDYVNATHAHMQ